MVTRADLKAQRNAGPAYDVQLAATVATQTVELGSLNTALEDAHAAESIEAARTVIQHVRPDLTPDP